MQSLKLITKSVVALTCSCIHPVVYQLVRRRVTANNNSRYHRVMSPTAMDCCVDPCDVTSTCSQLACGGGSGGMTSLVVACSCQADHASQHMQQPAVYNASVSGIDVRHDARSQALLPVYDYDYPGHHTVTLQRHLSAVPAAAAKLDSDAAAVGPSYVSGRLLDCPRVMTPFHDLQRRHVIATTDNLPGYIANDARNQKLNSASWIPSSVVDESSRDCLEKSSAPPESSHDSRTRAGRCSGSGGVRHSASPVDQQLHVCANSLLAEYQWSHDGHCYVPRHHEVTTDQRLQDNAIERERSPTTMTGNDTSCAHHTSTASIDDKTSTGGRRSVSGAGRRSATEEQVPASEQCDSSKELLNGHRAVDVKRPLSERKNAVSESSGQYVMT